MDKLKVKSLFCVKIANNQQMNLPFVSTVFWDKFGGNSSPLIILAANAQSPSEKTALGREGHSKKSPSSAISLPYIKALSGNRLPTPEFMEYHHVHSFFPLSMAICGYCIHGYPLKNQALTPVTRPSSQKRALAFSDSSRESANPRHRSSGNCPKDALRPGPGSILGPGSTLGPDMFS